MLRFFRKTQKSSAVREDFVGVALCMIRNEGQDLSGDHRRVKSDHAERGSN